MTEEEIIKELEKHSTNELLDFRRKIRTMETPVAWAFRFYISRIIVDRYQKGTIHKY